MKLQMEGSAQQMSALFETSLEGLDSQTMDASKLLSATQNVSSLLRELKETALNVTSVQEVSPSCRRTACFASTHHPLADESEISLETAVPRCVEPVYLLVGLETSGSWPIHPEAFKMTKLALYAQLSTALIKRGLFAKANQGFVDLFCNGFVFRLTFMTDRDEKEDGSLVRERHYHSWIKKSVDRHVSLPLTVKLLKRWASAQLFDFHVHEYIWEILAVHVYEQQTGQATINSPLAGFLRVLHLVAEFAWGVMPLITDPDQELTMDEVRAIQLWYTQERAKDIPLFSMAVCTSFDRQSSLTQGLPDNAVLTRLRHLAQQTVSCAMAPLRSLFELDWSAFDVVLHLNRQALPHPERALSHDDSFKETSTLSGTVLSHIPLSVLKKYSRKQTRNQLLVGFDPLQKLWASLTDHFGYSTLFCCDRYGGSRIGVHWKPEAFQLTMEPKLTQLSSWIQVEDSFLPDLPSILTEISVLGRGIIDRIDHRQ